MASSFCTPLSARAPTFVPRRASPFDASTSNSHQSRQDSDCGSSSGLGGMKTQELASEEGGSSSSGAQGAYSGVGTGTGSGGPPAFMPRPNGFPPFCVQSSMNLAQGLPHWVHPTPPGGNNDLFLHVQCGETLSVCIGNEFKNITGPATVRMVGETGISPQALPIQVPPGHMIHQIVDEQGFLRHLILSPERTAPPYPPSVATPSSGSNRLVSSPMSFHNNLYTVVRPQEKKYFSYHAEESTEGEVDVEEQERLKDMLSRIQPPKIIRADGTSADIEWDEIDTSEASAPGGPFPQIDRSEFVYHIVLFEGTGKFISNYPCDLLSGNQMRLCELRPNTDYYVQLKASLEERGVLGEPSEPVSFKTSTYRPDPPLMIKVNGKGADWFSLTWRFNNDNGSPITHYNVYMDRDQENKIEKVWEGRYTEARIANLEPATSYHVRVTASNHIGESLETSISVSTKSDGIPPQPSPPQVNVVSNKGIKLNWIAIPDLTYSVEMHDVDRDVMAMLKEKITASNTFIADLSPGTTYRFRLQAHSPEGDSPMSEWIQTRMTGQQRLKSDSFNSDRVLVPCRPYVINHIKSKPIVGWRCPNGKEREFEFVVEGSTATEPAKFRTLYKGPQSTYLVKEDDIVNIRVQSFKRGVYSDPSETLSIYREEEEDIVRPEQPAPPIFTPNGKGCLEVSWNPSSVAVPSTATILYEVKRLASATVKSDLIYCGPHTTCTISKLGNREHVEVQVRSVLVIKNGMRYESEWSTAAGASAPVEVPPAPVELQLEKDFLTWRMPETTKPVRYKMYCLEQEDEEAEEMIFETLEPRYPLQRLGFAKSYSCKVSAFFAEGEEGDKSEPIAFTTPSGVPAQPESVSVDADSTTSLLLRWNSPDCRGDKITQYRIRVESKSEVVRESNVLIPYQPSCEYRITDLKPDSRYRIEISAQNNIGSGVSAAISGKTKALPPAPPRLDAEAEPFCLKLKWKPEATHSFMSYRLVRLSDNDNHEVVFEGEQCFTKLKNLTENTEYRFQIRAADKLTGCGPWSEIYCFTTSLAQPPNIRVAPTATPVGVGCYQIEWAPIVGKPSNRHCFYRLQAIDCVDVDSKWHVVYEGMTTSYTVKACDYPGPLQLRVSCVRPREEGREVVGTPSPVVYIQNTQAKRRSSEEEIEQRPIVTKPRLHWIKFGSDKGITIISVMVFAAVSCCIALFFDTLYIRSPDT